MSVEFLNFQDMAINQNENRGVFARFYDKSVKTGNIKKNGMPEFANKLYIEIRIKDERDVFDQPATAEHIKRFAVEYNKYLSEKKEIGRGTPLSSFAFLSAEQIESCKFRNIFSVEALAALDDEKAKELDLNMEKKLAADFLKASKNNQVLFENMKKERKYLEEIRALKEEIERLKTNGGK